MTRKTKAIAILAAIGLIASAAYLLGGLGWYSDPIGYAIAWLVFLASAAYAVPAILWAGELACRTAEHIRVVRRRMRTDLAQMSRRVHGWPAALADRRHAPARVVRSSSRVEAGR